MQQAIGGGQTRATDKGATDEGATDEGAATHPPWKCRLWGAKRLAMPGPEQISLRPPQSAVELRTYGFGVIPFDGRFTRFDGLMRYDPSNTGLCEVMLQIEAASLAMGNEPIRDLILGPDMMEAARFPQIAFRGSCQGEAMIGELAMHGETHPLTLDYVRSAGTVIATGRLRREDWGVMGGQLIGGSIIRIRVTLPDPFDAQAA
jgi:polyisoprenoid-binding protein YceI